MTHLVRAVLAVGLLIGFYLLAVGTALGLAVGVVAVFQMGVGAALGAKALVLALPVVAAIGYGIFGRSQPQDPPGLPVTAREQPRLWALARESADLARTRNVDEIRLLPEANAAVSDSATWLGLRPGTRRLYLGVPLLLGLDERQLRSVVAHEFGHYSGRHTVLGGVTYRGAESMRRTMTRLGPQHLATRLFSLYARLYFAVSHSVNRRQELDADKLSAEAVGADVAASALLELRPLALAWKRYLETFAGMGAAVGRRPDGLFVGFGDFLSDPAVAEVLKEIREQPDEGTASVYDTHPSTTQRVTALGMAAAPVRRREGSSVGWLDEPDKALGALERSLYDADLRPTPLRDLAPLAGDDAARRHAHLVDKLLTEKGRSPGLATVMQYLGNGMGRELVRRDLPPDLSPDTVTDLTARVLSGYLAAALIEVGQAGHRLDWDRGYVLVDPTGAALDLADLVGEVLAAPGRASELVELLRLCGVPDAFRASTPTAQAVRKPDPVTSRVLGVLSPVSFAKTLVVHEDGLLWLTPNASDRLAIAGRMNGREAATLMERWSGLSVADLMRTRKSRAVPWARVGTLTVVQLTAGRARIVCEVPGEAELVVKVQKNSLEAGQPFEAIRHFLGERVVVNQERPARV